MATERGAGLYVHIPFCARICPYCDFAVTTGGGDRHRAFVDSLLSEFDLAEETAWQFDTLYLGGGTPSALGGGLLERIFREVDRRAPLSGMREICLESNPEDVDASSVSRWKDLGVSRLSLGVQSFDDGALRFLGRGHDAETADRATRAAVAAGFEAVSVDLIYGLPPNSVGGESVRESIERAVDCGVDHISAYQLTVESATSFGGRQKRGELVELDSDGQGQVFEAVHSVLEEHGFEAYEVSSFARSVACQSRHNRKYWEGVPYLGLGPSAHSFDGRRRWWNRRTLQSWSKALFEGDRPIEAEETLTSEAAALERVMLGLRTRAGIDLDEIGALLERDLALRNAGLIDRWVESGFVRRRGTRLEVTRAGLAVADGMAASLDLG